MVKVFSSSSKRTLHLRPNRFVPRKRWWGQYRVCLLGGMGLVLMVGTAVLYHNNTGLRDELLNLYSSNGNTDDAFASHKGVSYAKEEAEESESSSSADLTTSSKSADDNSGDSRGSRKGGKRASGSTSTTSTSSSDSKSEPSNIQINVMVEMALAKSPSCKGKERFVRIILLQSKNPRLITPQLCDKLPTPAQIEQRFGPHPIIVGLETCANYRAMLQPERNNGTAMSPQPRVAGLYNTGTNALARAFQRNLIQLPKPYTTPDNPHDVPWGKHMPASFRLNNTHPKNNRDNRFRVMPIVIVRDPFHWMKSMCKEWYDTKWNKPPDRRCPAIVKIESNLTTYKVFAKLQQAKFHRVEYKSMPDLWSEWNRGYFQADYPRLMIRFEDALYRTEEVIETIRDCVGLPKSDKPFQQHAGAAKIHGKSSDLASSYAKYMTDAGRHHGLNAADRRYSNAVLDPALMRVFQYSYAPEDAPPEDLTGPFAGREKPIKSLERWWPADQ